MSNRALFCVLVHHSVCTGGYHGMAGAHFRPETRDGGD